MSANGAVTAAGFQQPPAQRERRVELRSQGGRRIVLSLRYEQAEQLDGRKGFAVERNTTGRIVSVQISDEALSLNCAIAYQKVRQSDDTPERTTNPTGVVHTKESPTLVRGTRMLDLYEFAEAKARERRQRPTTRPFDPVPATQRTEVVARSFTGGGVL